MRVSFPGESPEYRAARDRLLEQEVALRRAMEAVAAARRQLPAGGVIPQDYAFHGQGADAAPISVRFSELFAPGKDTLAIYSFMFGPERAEPCPGCTHFLDGLNGAALLGDTLDVPAQLHLLFQQGIARLPVGGAFVGEMKMFEVALQVLLHARQTADPRQWLPQA